MSLKKEIQNLFEIIKNKNKTKAAGGTPLDQELILIDRFTQSIVVESDLQSAGLVELSAILTPRWLQGSERNL